MRIILAEDEPAIRGLLSQGLKRQGAIVAECETVAQAIEAASGGFDAAVLDANLPDGSGLDAAVWLAEANPAARIVICSGYPVDASEIGLPPDTPAVILPKPFRIGELFSALRLGTSD